MTDKKAFIFALFLLIFSLWLTVSILFTLSGGGGPAFFGGYFLYNTFYHSAFYVPLYLVFCSFFLLRKKFDKSDIIVLILTLVPFFTTGLALRIYIGAGNTSLEKMIVNSFGPLSPVLLLLLVFIEAILIMNAALFLRKNPSLLETVSGNIPDVQNTGEIDEVPAQESSAADAGVRDADAFSEAAKMSPETISDIQEDNNSDADSFEKSTYFVNNTVSEEYMHDRSISDSDEDPVSEESAGDDSDQRESFKTLSLSSVSLLKGGKRGSDMSEPEVLTEEVVYQDEPGENYEPGFEYSEDEKYNPADYGLQIPDRKTITEEPDVSGSILPDADDIYMQDEASGFSGADDEEGMATVDGVDYSEPAYFRQQKDAPFKSDEIPEPEIDREPSSDNSYYEDTEYDQYHAVPDERNAGEYEQESETAGYTEKTEEDYSDEISVEYEEEFPEEILAEAENEFSEDVKGSGIQAEEESYDPLTEYNRDIEVDESGEEIFDSESDDEFLEDDIEDDIEDDGPSQPDNTAIVKQYFESARFIKPSKKPGKYEIPVEDVLDLYQEESYDRIDARAREEAEVLKKTLAEFKIEAEVTGIRKGPVITMFEILPAPGVKLSRITNLADNIALRLAASRVRIVAPIPGKHAVGIEVPNRKRAIVSFRELIEVDYKQYRKDDLPVVLGKDITGEEQIVDLTKTPHLLIAGATGSGKSVCVNSLITSILYKRAPRDVKMILIDPKIVELKLYNGIPHLLTPVITDAKKAYQALQYCVFEMERRYSLLDALSCRDIKSFNKKIKEEKIATMPLPYIVVVVDEFADLMATTGKELESTLARLAAMSRAVGIHLVLATQRPSIDVITGLIKANIPSRIAFMVASKTDSRIIIDSMGAEMLLGKGDMLFTSAWNPYPVRIQGAFLSEGEVERVVEQVKEYGEPEYIDDEIFVDDEDDDYISMEEETINDPLMNRALEIVATAGKASASYLQRRLKIGYNRAARLVEEMERKGIVGPQNGSKPRDLLHIPDNFRDQQD